MKSVLIPLSLIALGFSSCKSETKVATTPAGVTPYPIQTCLVSGEKLGEMGEPVVIIHEGREIKFCCKSCVPKFEKDPAKYLAKLK